MENPLELSDHELDRIVEEKYSTLFRPGYIKIENCTLPKNYSEMKTVIDELEISDTDIVVAGFPRSGTTWLSELVWLISHELDYENATKHVFERVPLLDLCFTFDRNNIPRHIEIAEILNNPIGRFKSLPNPRCVRTHLPFQLLPKEIQNGEKKPKIIYIARNPLDVCVSFYHLSTTLYFIGNMDEFCKLFLSGRVNYGPYFTHVLTYWKLRDQTNVLFLKYEDMKKDTGEAIQQVAAFLGKRMSDEEKATLQKHLSFDSLKNNAAVNTNFGESFKVPRPLAPVIRCGKIGGYKGQLPHHYNSKPLTPEAATSVATAPTEQIRLKM
ncbi:Sulfotransfer 1 domain containing protein [Asbolus verrucosus]|uniref:Sulfotransfer 1 domain containing protein n=1 Tax=Asbolus verrucosus TaxID=1661398 RepID=A0A482V1E7_ASBVE|nr:Sulfotransfer 1 domain containing protein [Asbolus verrucosus]